MGGKGRGVEGNRWEEKKIGSDKEREMLGGGRKKWRRRWVMKRIIDKERREKKRGKRGRRWSIQAKMGSKRERKRKGNIKKRKIIKLVCNLDDI